MRRYSALVVSEIIMLAASKFLLSSAANKKNTGCSGVQTEVLKSSWVLSYAGALGLFFLFAAGLVQFAPPLCAAAGFESGLFVAPPIRWRVGVFSLFLCFANAGVVAKLNPATATMMRSKR